MNRLERVAEALWQAESLRASDRPRSVRWEEEESEETRERWKFMAEAAVEAVLYWYAL